MFIDSPGLGSSSLQRSEMHGSTYASPEHCAPLERQTLVSRAVYRHLAPPEPEHSFEILKLGHH